MPAALEMGNVVTSRQGVPPGTESPQLISWLQHAGLTGGSKEGKIIPNRKNDCEVELISCIICLPLEGTNAVLLTGAEERGLRMKPLSISCRLSFGFQECKLLYS